MKPVFKPLALLLAGLIAMCVFLTGCSSGELGYLNLNREILGLDVFETTSALSISVGKLPPGASGKENAMLQWIVDSLLADFSLNWESKTDYGQNAAVGDFYLLNKPTGKKQVLFDFVFSKETIYANVSQLKNVVAMFSPGDVAEFDRMLNGAEWISYSGHEIVQALPPGVNVRDSITDFSMNRAKKRSMLIYQLLDDLSQTAFKEFTSGAVTQEGNTFKVRLDAQEASELIRSLLTYSVNHIDQIGGCLKTFVQGLTDEDLAAMSLTEEQRRETLANIDQMVAGVSGDLGQQFLLGLDSSLDASALGDSAFYTTLAKTGPGSYRKTTGVFLDIRTPENPSDEFSLSLSGEDNIRAVPSFQVDVPTRGVITLTQLLARTSVTMVVETRQGSYMLSNGLKTDTGRIDSRIVDGRLYLPVRELGQALGEGVGWDAASRRTYVVHEGEAVYMESIIVSGRAYVRIRDFENIGYHVAWNPASGVAIITRTAGSELPDSQGLDMPPFKLIGSRGL